MRRMTPAASSGNALAFCDTEVDSFRVEDLLAKIEDASLVSSKDSSCTIVPPASVDEADLLSKLPVVIGHTSLPDSRAHLKLLGCEIGRGAMGRVEVAEQVALQREVAVKRPIQKHAGSQSLVQILREGRVTGCLAHPNVVPVYMLGKDASHDPLLVMKRISGASWSRFIADPKLVLNTGHQGDALSWHIDVLLQVCNAVHYSHSKGIIHRDLKPDNIMIGEFGEIYVLDWGLAVGLEVENPLGLPSVASLTALAGTPGYMPPEMVRVDSNATGVRSDVYLLGGILHSIMTGGKARHEGRTVMETLGKALRSEPSSYSENVPPELAAICNRATACDPEDRFASADAFRRALVDFKRHRHSTALCREAQARLTRFDEELALFAKEAELSSDRLYRLFGECRFGFRQALREWDENVAAREGLQELLEHMIDYEVEQGDVRAVTKLLADLPVPNKELQRKAEALRHEIAERSLRYEELQELARRNDGSVGRRERLLTVSSMGVVWAGFYASLGWLTRHGIYDFGHGSYLLINGLFGLFLLVATLRWRVVLQATTVNKNFLWSVWTAFFAALVWWSVSWHWGLGLAKSMAVTMVLYAVITWMAAAAVDRRIRWGALAYLFGGGYLSLTLRYPWEVLACATAGAMFGIAMAWYKVPGTDGSAEEAAL